MGRGSSFKLKSFISIRRTGSNNTNDFKMAPKKRAIPKERPTLLKNPVINASNYIDPELTEIFDAQAAKMIEQVAIDLTPSFDDLIKSNHRWCFDVCTKLERELIRRGYKVKVVPDQNSSEDEFCYYSFQHQGIYHLWLETEDGIILDPTVKQFFMFSENPHKNKDVPEISKKDFMKLNPIWVVDQNDPRRGLYLNNPRDRSDYRKR